MSKFIEEKVRTWGTVEARETNLRLNHLEKRLFNSYEICLPPAPSFWSRCKKWIENANGDIGLEQQLFESISHIFYVGRDEFTELYKRAYNGPIARWLIDKENISFTDPDASIKLRNAVEMTWFCPITDSMKINPFYHINNIPAPGADIRPDWRTLVSLGDEGEIRQYIRENNLKYIVLLEDFVGGGSQIAKAVDFVCHFRDLVEILIVPLIICPKGFVRSTPLSNRDKIKVDPVLHLSQSSFIMEVPSNDEGPHLTMLRDLSDSTYLQVSSNIPPDSVDPKGNPLKPYHPLGWDRTGGLVVMFTNTPDNTLPLFHWKSDTWYPIFPRHSRN
jgi:hypothetical protein